VIHFVETPGLWLSVRAGNLDLRQRDGTYIWLDRRVHVIVAVAHGFCVTTPAIRLCAARHVELLISDDTAAFVALFAPEARGDGRRAALKVRERQFRATFDRQKTIELARAIVAKKIEAEVHSDAPGRAATGKDSGRCSTCRSEGRADLVEAMGRFWDAVCWSSGGRWMAIVAGQLHRQATGKAWRARSAIHGAKCRSSDAGLVEFFRGDSDGTVDKGDCRMGIAPMLWVPA
jgi:hypothetical protein